MRYYSQTLLPLCTLLVAGVLGSCQQSAQVGVEEQDRLDKPAVESPTVSDSLFLGLVFPYIPPKPSGPVTQAALLMTRHGAPIERVVLGSFLGRAIVLDSLAERQFPEGTLLGFRADNIDSGTDVAVLRANDTTLHVLKRPVHNDKATAEFNLIKTIPIAPGSRLRLVR